ncbi:MAG: hypothetical protein J6V80_01955 [Clostridia bacterium]|nr:hypothetical protein [Clostridia bacterium]
MTNNMTKVHPKYFAAANSYRGFINYFDRIFSVNDYDRLYILKGGPGCGKSSFMKKISSTYGAKKCAVEEIYCSSDPHSLDGVIVKNAKKKIAIIDGTAPHESDTKIPGAMDEIIDLAQGWDNRLLKAQAKGISEFVAEKGRAYNAAYHYLHSAGCEADFVKRIHLNLFEKSKAKSWAESILNHIQEEKESKITTRLVSSFGRYGRYKLNTLNELGDNIISVGGEESAAMIFLSYVYELLKHKPLSIIHFSSPLDPELTEAIYLVEQKIAIVYDESADKSSNELFSISPADEERMKVSRKLYNDCMTEAKRWFSIASDMHFRLEKIYGEAMNFNINDRILEKKCAEIDDILETSG